MRARRTREAHWPADVAIVGPGRPHPAETWLPDPGRELAATSQDADRIPAGRRGHRGTARRAHLARPGGTDVAVVIDNVHLLGIEDVRLLVGALPTARLILLGHPRPEQILLAAHLGISAESLDGWGTDTIAAVFGGERSTLDYRTAQRDLSLTAGLPLYVLSQHS